MWTADIEYMHIEYTGTQTPVTLNNASDYQANGLGLTLELGVR